MAKDVAPLHIQLCNSKMHLLYFTLQQHVILEQTFAASKVTLLLVTAEPT
jgi:hypothetical protein